ncbi:hypothetical protein KIS1582_1216 [Cytobacillus firmus]|uniref:Uncharacterized protein n=1 Tax=Cytobacillus firmus TaxID=1399 RepID=A0A800MYY5_CYTFI|nr:hypothetical protein KIS1582_1216 [Cytobacillus firmus]
MLSLLKFLYIKNNMDLLSKYYVNVKKIFRNCYISPFAQA